MSEARNARRAIARKRAAERTKIWHDYIVPLPKRAIAVLNESQSITGKGRYVFPSPARQKTPHLHRDALSKALREMNGIIASSHDS